MKCSLVYQACIFFLISMFCERLILADKSRLKKLTIFSAFIPASLRSDSDRLSFEVIAGVSTAPCRARGFHRTRRSIRNEFCCLQIQCFYPVQEFA